METLAARLNAARTARGLSERALSKTAGLSPSHAGTIEHRGRRTSAAVLAKLAAALGVPLEWLAVGSGPLPDFLRVQEAA